MGAKGVFETMRCYKGAVFALEEHLDRAIKGCSVLGVEAPDKKILINALYEEIKKKRFKDARVRLDIYKDIYGNHLSVSIKKISNKKIERSGLSAYIETGKKIKPGVLTGIKSRERRFYEDLYEAAKRRKFDEVIFCNSSGEVVEGTRTNVFIVKDGLVMTPSLKSGCLGGITRKIVIGLLKRRKMPFKECRILPSDIMRADEIFLTNSIKEVAPVVYLNRKAVGSAKPGVITKKIMVFYKKQVEKECFLR